MQKPPINDYQNSRINQIKLEAHIHIEATHIIQMNDIIVDRLSCVNQRLNESLIS